MSARLGALGWAGLGGLRGDSGRKTGVQDRSREVRAGLGEVFVKFYRDLSRGVRRSRSLPDPPRARALRLGRTSRAAS